MEKTDEITYMIQTLSKTFPTLLETLVQERDQYMVASLRSVARQSTSVVAVVGRGHLAGIAANWEQDIPVSLDLPICHYIPCLTSPTGMPETVLSSL